MKEKILIPKYPPDLTPLSEQEYETIELDTEGMGHYIDPIFDACWLPNKSFDNVVMPSDEELKSLIENWYQMTKEDKA